MANQLERRFTHADAKVEFKADAAPGESKVQGYASVFNSYYEDPMFKEVIRPGTFSRALKEEQDVRSLIDHEPTLIIGRTKSHTLKLVQDERGLYASTSLPDTTYANDLRAKMSRGDVDGMSFGFVVKDERWGTQDGKLFREILDVDLFDVSVVTYPAYPATSANLRSQLDILESGKKFLEEHRTAAPDVGAYIASIEKYLATIERL